LELADQIDIASDGRDGAHCYTIAWAILLNMTLMDDAHVVSYINLVNLSPNHRLQRTCCQKMLLGKKNDKNNAVGMVFPWVYINRFGPKLVRDWV
jgi:hypothetical protein